MRKKIVLLTFALGIISITGTPVSAGPLEIFIQSLKEDAKREAPGFKDFSVKRGEEFFYREVNHPDDPTKRSCFTCHTRNLKQTGTHHVSGKVIEPLAPSVNPKRLSDVKKLRKWFKRNCKWVLQRTCTPVEKGDFILFLQSS